MALRYFRGRMDFAKLSNADLADAASALTVLERLAQKGVIELETGASRNAGPRPDMKGGRELARPKLQIDILAILVKYSPMTYPELLLATGMKDGSLSANLTLLEREGMITKTVGERPAGTKGRSRRENNTYAIVATKNLG